MLGHPRRAAGVPLPADLRDAGARGDRRRRRGGGGRGLPARRDHDPPGRLRDGAAPAAQARGRGRRAGQAGRRKRGALLGRDDDRAPPRLPDRRPHRRPRRLLLLRHQRPHPDDDRPLARRRRGQLPARVPRREDHRPQPVRGHRRPRGRRAGQDRSRARARGEPGAEARRLRRARRRSDQHPLLRLARPRLRQLLAVTGRRSPGSPPPRPRSRLRRPARRPRRCRATRR